MDFSALEASSGDDGFLTPPVEAAADAWVGDLEASDDEGKRAEVAVQRVIDFFGYDGWGCLQFDSRRVARRKHGARGTSRCSKRWTHTRK